MSNPRKKNNRIKDGGKHKKTEVVFPVYFETDLYTCKLISKYEAVTVYLSNEAPVIVHQKRSTEYVIEYRMVLNDAINRTISANSFMCRYITAQALARNILGTVGDECGTVATRPLVTITDVTTPFTLVDIQRLDRFKFHAVVNILVDADPDPIEFLAVDVFATINRYGDIKYMTLTIADPTDFVFGDGLTQIGIEGYLHIIEIPENVIGLGIGGTITLKPAGATALRAYNPITDTGDDGDYNIDYGDDFSH